MRLLLLIGLVMLGTPALACDSKPLKGYKGPCELDGWMGFSQRYFYTRPRHSEEGYKRWDLETGKVVAEGLTHEQAQNTPPEVLRYEYTRERKDDYLVLAEARDKPIALLAGRIGKTNEELIVYDLEKGEVIGTYDSNKNRRHDRYGRLQISPDGRYYTYQSYVRDAATGKGIAHIPITVEYAPDMVAAFGQNDRYRPTVIQRRATDSPDTTLASWKTPFLDNQGLYPVDEDRAWVFLRHYQKFGSDHSKVAHSSTGVLYLVNFSQGDVERRILFDAGESAYERELRDYMAAKFRYARDRFEDQVRALKTPPMYLLKESSSPKPGAVTLDGDRYLALQAAGRTLVYDLEANQPVGMFYSTIYKQYPDGNYGGPGVLMTQGLGPSPVKGSLSPFTAIWLPDSQTFLAQLHDTVYEFTPDGRHTGKTFKGKQALGYLGNRQVVTVDRKSRNNRFTLENLAVHDLDTGKQVRRLLKKTVDYSPLWLSVNGRYAVVARKKDEWLVIDTSSGDEITELDASSRALKLAHNGVVNMDDGTYRDFATLTDQKLAWAYKRDYRFLRFQGQYIVSYSEGKGIEVFDLGANRYITPIAIDTGMYQAASEYVYVPARNEVAVVASGGVATYGKFDDSGTPLPANAHLGGKRATGYLLDLDALSLSPIMVTALPWEDPLVAMKEAARAQKEREEEQRQRQAQARQQQLLAQEEALMANVDALVAQTPELDRLALFYPDGPIGPYVSDARKAQALVDYMKLWERPNYHSNTYGLIDVPFQFIEDMLPLMPTSYASQARSVMHQVRERQLTQQRLIERQAGWEKLKQAMSAEIQRSVNARPQQLESRDPVYEYQKKMMLEGKSNRPPCSSHNPCGPGDMFRAYD
ncbi:MAG: hypothetical protein P1U64_00385 [Alcanivoracaceae bacterium]|nr:hypothetical protein [Alcanivoracaceae bacterium]